MSDYPYDLGEHSYPVSTRSTEAQLWFDRGLLWAYSFNHDEAARCFEKAVEHDPRCAMAYWGMAYAAGPNYNKPWRLFDDRDLAATLTYAHEALGRARSLAQDATSVERALIGALVHRFPERAAGQDTAEPALLDLAYADAMRTVHEEHTEDLDATALFTEALLCVSPRALWCDDGEPSGENIVEAREVLETVLARPEAQRHPALNHMYIHLMDMSSQPELALSAADALRHAVPDGSHMAHMATHIDAACGDYRNTIDSNRVAAAVDNTYFARERRIGRYFSYRAHNIRFLAYGAMMAGRSQDALWAARRLNEIVTPEVLKVTSPPMADLAESYRTTLPHVLIRFGRWEEILGLELPEDQELFSATTAMICYSRAIAFSALGRIAEAEVARDVFETARAAVPETRFSALPAKEAEVLEVAAAMLDGELEYRKGNVGAAFADLRRAIELEDALPYTDPPAWLLPARHPYGALLLEQGHIEEAAAVYRADLRMDRTLARWRTHPNNVWSLHGYHECLTRLGRDEEARQLALQRDIAVGAADVRVGASCFCRLTAFVDEAPGCCGTEAAGGPRSRAGRSLPVPALGRPEPS
ncbi:tetratricopeptide repeat protein [Streptomyces hygroscopicus]|uniref:tetratricopeptide repeat protein n=1 Tax=Streptomyces hygroscopicus TaxID=1912 RepID=UPI00381E1594